MRWLGPFSRQISRLLPYEEHIVAGTSQSKVEERAKNRQDEKDDKAPVYSKTTP